MALTEIEYGSLASSEVMNNNFEYLDEKITDVSESLTSTAAAINSNIATINSSMASMSETLSQSIEDLGTDLTTASDTSFSTNGLYVTTYRNGTSWYREYFSNKEKTTRVWIEQGGQVWQNSYVSFLRPMSNSDYSIKLQDINNTFIEGAKPASFNNAGFTSSFRYGCNIRWSVAGV